MPGRYWNAVMDVAVDNGGYVTPALVPVVPAVELRKMVAWGILESAAHGVYRVPLLPPDRCDEFILARLGAKGRGAISHDSALLVHELCDINPTRVHLTIPVAYRIGRAGGDRYEIHRGDLADTEVTRIEAVVVTTIPRTLDDAIRSVPAYLARQAVATASDRGAIPAGRRDGLLRLLDERAPGVTRPAGAKEFQRLLQRHAQAIDQPAQRVLHLVRIGVVCAFLDEIRHEDGGHLFIVKGGTAMHLRLGIRARATTDLDVTFRGNADAWLARFDEATTNRTWNGFTIARKGPPVEIDAAGLRYRPWRVVLQLRDEGRDFLERLQFDGRVAMVIGAGAVAWARRRPTRCSKRGRPSSPSTTASSTSTLKLPWPRRVSA